MKRLAAAALLLGLLLAGLLWARWRPSPGEAALVAARDAWRAGKIDEAAALFEEARAEAKAPHVAVPALLGSARALYEGRGDLAGGRTLLEGALAAARAAGDPALEADVRLDLGRFAWTYELDRATPLGEQYEPALALYRQAGDRRGIAAATARIALVDLAEERLEAAARRLEESRALYAELADEAGLGEVHGYLGALAARLERYPQADAHYRQALDLADRRGDLAARRQVVPLVAYLEVRRRDYARALALYDELIAGGPPAVALRDHLRFRGHTLLHLGRFAEGRESYEQAIEVAGRLPGRDPRFEAETLVMLSHAHRLGGDLVAAAGALDRADAVPVAAKGWGVEVTGLLARADLYDQQGRGGDAVRVLLAAAEVEGRTYGAARSLFFQTQYGQVFDRLLSLLFQGAVVREEAERLVFRLLELMRYRSFRGVLVGAADPAPGAARAPEPALVERIDRLGRRLEAAPSEESLEELRRAYADYEDALVRSQLAALPYERLKRARPIDLADLQARLDGTTALIEYVIAGDRGAYADRAFALVVRRDRLRSVVLPETTSALEARVKLLRDLFAAEAADDGWRPVAAALGRGLIEPLIENGVLAGVDRLVIAPMGFLHELPFAALSVAGGEGEAHLVERYSLTVTPSATLWARPRAASSPGGAETFGHGAAAGALPPLPFAEREAAAVAALIGGRAHLGAAATETAFRRAAGVAGWLHVAAHGVAEPRLPLRARVLLAGDGENDGALTVGEILATEVRATLVSLSACGSGLAGRGRVEVDRVGFVEAFLHAGAGDVLATVLPVPDRSAAVLMSDFYRALARSSPAEALAAAQREMLRREGSHPRQWAPFVLVGSGG